MRDDFTRANVPHGTDITQYPPINRITPVPIVAGADERLNLTALRLIINTSGYSDENGYCLLTQEQHGALAHRHRNTIGRVQQLLARLGYLEVRHDLYDPDRRRKRRTVYRVTVPPAPTGQ